MEISSDMVRELREKSGAGIMDCKRALQEAKGSQDGALDFLRKEGMVKASRKSGRIASEGLIGAAVSPDGTKAALVEVRCETDFVARTDPFQEFVREVSHVAVEASPKNVDALKRHRVTGGTVEEALKGLVALLGENMEIPRVAAVAADRGRREVVAQYLHAGSKLGVLVKATGASLKEADVRDVAMHVAAMHPAYIDRHQVPPAVVEKEREIIRASPDLSGKPANLIDKIMEGKLARFFGEVCLMEQPFIKDPQGKQNVGAFLKSRDPAAKIVEMIRFQVGENV